jgi:hypothetical protein
MSQTFEKQIAGGRGILAANLTPEDMREYALFWTYGYNIVMAQTLTESQRNELENLHSQVAKKLHLPEKIVGLVQPVRWFKQ